MKGNDNANNNPSRKSRKIGEKLRRERLNTLLAQLAAENPWSAKSEKRVDKAGILKLTVNYLKFHHGLKKLKISNGKESSYFNSSAVLKCLNETINGFLLIVSETENIVFVSSSIRKLLGLHQADVVGSELSKFVHPEDLELFRKQLTESKDELHTINPSLVRPNGATYTGYNTSDNHSRSFYVRMLKAAERNNNEQIYEMVHFNGQLRSNVCNQTDSSDSRVFDKHWLIAVGRPSTSGIINEVPTLYSKEDEFVTQFDLMGNIWFSDHRSSVILGQMPSESVGKSCYSKIFKEDIPFVSHSHSLIMKTPITMTVFRMSVRHQCQYLLSRSIVACDSWTKEPKFIVSLTIALSETEGSALLEQQRKDVGKLLALKDKSESEETESESKPGSVCNSIKTELEHLDELSCQGGCESLLSVVDDISVNCSLLVKRDLIDSGDDSASSRLVKSLSDSDLEDEQITSGITLSVDTPAEQKNSLSVLKRLLLGELEESPKKQTSDMLNMDMHKSFNDQLFQNFDKSVSNEQFEGCDREDMFQQMLYKHSFPGSMTKSVITNGMVGNSHSSNLFHPYQRSFNKVFANNSKEDISQNDSTLFHGNQKACVSQLNSPLSYQAQGISSRHQHLSSMSHPRHENISHSRIENMAPHSRIENMASHSRIENIVSKSRIENMASHSRVDTIPPHSRIENISSMSPISTPNIYPSAGYPGTSSNHSFFTQSSYPLYNRSMNPELESRQNPSFINSSGNKDYRECSFFGGDPIHSQSSMVGCSSSQNDSHFIDTITTPNTDIGNFHPFAYSPNSMGSKPICDYPVSGEHAPNSYRTSLGFGEEKIKYSDFSFTQQGGFCQSPDRESMSSGKSGSSRGSHISTDIDTLDVSKIQSPTVDSVTNPETPKMNDEKDLQIQFKLSQQLHTKQNLIGQSLTNQRDELTILKTQLKDRGSVNGQYMELLQRLTNLEKEVQEQDTVLTDLREQSRVKIKQLMTQES